jgi:ferredoxin
VVRVAADRCIRCGACASLAPGVFDVSRLRARVTREPETDAERAASHAAALVCPTQAIEAPAVFAAPSAAPVFAALFAEAERVRWRMEDLPFAAVDQSVVTPAQRQLVREAAFSELTTTSATKKFLDDFADDVDLTRWISVWFYEETKHPHALLEWLAQFGESVDDAWHRKGRATAPFMKSRTGTLVTNIISELVASASYLAMARTASEPVLRAIGERLGGDEARHAASFFAFARRHIARAADPDTERRDALKVLYMWFSSNALVSHPVNEFYGRTDAQTEVAAIRAEMPRDRIFRAIGALCDLPLDGDTDLVALMQRRLR